MQQYLGFTAGRWLWSVRAGGQSDSLIANKEAGGTVREIDVEEQSHRDYLRSGYLHHRLPSRVLLNHYRDNAITYKACATKMPEN